MKGVSSSRSICRSKTQYTTEAHAELVAEETAKKTNEEISTYQCKVCKLWHLTSQTPSERNRKKRKKKIVNGPYEEVIYKEIDNIGNKIKIDNQ
jgi:spore cortex formation protein SpoVR/YcgB (stage V sporulation)